MCIYKYLIVLVVFTAALFKIVIWKKKEYFECIQ